MPLAGEPDAPAPHRVLRVAADPNNLPFTNDKLEGFENKIAALVAHELQADLVYIWHAQRRGFFRQTLKEGDADIVLGVPAHFERALPTKPYYTSTYCFVSRKDKELHLASLDDAALHDLKIGVQMTGDDGVNPPPAHALADRGIINNVTGFTVYGDYAEPNPPARVVDAVAKGDIDVAVVWGPLAGYFAKREPVALDVVPVSPAVDPSGLPFVYSIAMGVRRQNKALRDELNAVLERKAADIANILDAYGVPRAAPLPGRKDTH